MSPLGAIALILPIGTVHSDGRDPDHKQGGPRKTCTLVDVSNVNVFSYHVTANFENPPPPTFFGPLP